MYVARPLLLSVVFCLTSGVAAAAQGVLFSEPLHITREVSDPISGTKTVVEEYCHGNRVISVSGTRTAIADYEKNELTEIDRAASTWSVTSFEQIAGARATLAPRQARRFAVDEEWRVRDQGPRTIAGRSGATVELERSATHGREVIRVTTDRRILFPRAAMEVLLGVAWPNDATAHGEAILHAMSRSGEGRRVVTNAAEPDKTATWGFPLEQILTFEAEGQTIESRMVVMRVGSELPPADLIAIPPRAERVESDLVKGRRLLEELDKLPPVSSSDKP